MQILMQSVWAKARGAAVLISQVAAGCWIDHSVWLRGVKNRADVRAYHVRTRAREQTYREQQAPFPSFLFKRKSKG